MLIRSFALLFFSKYYFTHSLIYVDFKMASSSAEDDALFDQACIDMTKAAERRKK